VRSDAIQQFLKYDLTQFLSLPQWGLGQETQQLLDKLKRTSCVHGAFIVIARIVKDRELLRTIVIHGLELLPQNFDRRGNERILAA